MVVPLEQMTTSRLVGDVARVQASSYGHPIVLTPEARPENVVDNDKQSSWVVGVRSRAIDEWIRIDYRTLVTASSMKMDFSARQPGGRIIERARLELLDASGTTLLKTTFTPADSNEIAVSFPSTSFNSAKITIEEESLSHLVDYSTAPGIAIGEITFPGVRSAEYIVLPTVSSSLFADARASAIVLTRQSIDPSIPHRSDMELNLQRIVTLPVAQSFALSGDARLSGRANERIVSNLTNLTMAKSSGRVFGSAQSIASLAVDGDLSTAWTTPLDQAVGSEIFFTLDGSRSTSQLRIRVRDDRFHSVPRRVTVTDASDTLFPLALTGENGLLTSQLDSSIQFPLQSLVIDEVRSRSFPNYFTKEPRELPVAIVEIDTGIDNTKITPQINSQCRSDLLEINDQPVSVRIVTTHDVFDTSQSFTVESCQNITLQAGDNFIRTARGLNTGIDLDQLVLTTDTFASTSTFTPVTVNSRNTTQLTARIETSTPQIISFGQSINRGWKASLRTPEGTLDLGAPFVVQGYANGWLVPQSGELTLEWTPQRFVRGSLIVSGIIAAGLIFFALRRKTEHKKAHVKNDLRDNFSPRRRYLIFLLFGLVAGFAGFLPAVATGLLLSLPRRYSMALIGLLVTIIAGTIVIAQIRYGYPPAWPLRLSGLTALTWTAVAVACINPLLRRH
jgi:hypothetical protein